MKMIPEDYRRLSEAIAAALARSKTSLAEMRDRYQRRGLGDRRFRWDLLWWARVDTTGLYGYLNDDHIDTALRRIVAGQPYRRQRT